mmetsp:Transcript_19430/g.64363  ORF Transcript_19430/g.64363 Transcript_19430/m.64363 type:complete len:98 (-) Transcript_19430:200-493(-)
MVPNEIEGDSTHTVDLMLYAAGPGDRCMRVILIYCFEHDLIPVDPCARVTAPYKLRSDPTQYDRLCTGDVSGCQKILRYCITFVLNPVPALLLSLRT